jgi:hypothetical protein
MYSVLSLRKKKYQITRKILRPDLTMKNDEGL